MNTQVAVTYRTTETLQAAIAGHVRSRAKSATTRRARPGTSLPADSLLSSYRPSHPPTWCTPRSSPTHGMRTAMPGTLRYHSISCACEQCIRVDERIPSVSPPVTIAFDADELCGYYEFHKFMDVELRCGFSKGHTSKHYDYRHRMKF